MKPFLCILLIVKCLFLQEHSQPVLLPAGTPVFLVLNCQIPFSSLDAGTILEANVYGPVKKNGKVLIEHNAMASVWVKRVQKTRSKKKLLLILVADSAFAVDGQQIRLRSADHSLRIENRSQSRGDYSLRIKAMVLHQVTIHA